MAISRLTGQDAKGAAASSSASATYPGATTSGNLLIATTYNNNNSTPTLNDAGFSKTIGKVNTNGATFAIWYKIADGTETTLTISATSAVNCKIHIYEYSGGANPITFDVSATSNGSGLNGGTQPASTATITTTNTADLIFGVAAWDGNTTAPVFSTGLSTRQTDAATIRLLDGDLIPGVIKTSFSATTNTQAGLDWSTLIAAFNASSGGAGISPSASLSPSSSVSPSISPSASTSASLSPSASTSASLSPSASASPSSQIQGTTSDIAVAEQSDEVVITQAPATSITSIAEADNLEVIRPTDDSLVIPAIPGDNITITS